MSTAAADLEEAAQALQRGDLALAQRRLKRVLAAAPGNTRANELMAYVAGNRGDLDEAHRLLVQATAAPAASATAWYYLGVSHRRRRCNAEAIGSFEKAIAIDPKLFAAWHDLGLARFDLDRIGEAIDAFASALALQPRSVEALHNRGRALHGARDLEHALASYDEALAIRPDFAPSWFNRGETLNDLRRYDEAIASYEKAAACGYDRSDVDWNLALTHLVGGDLARGFARYEARWKGTGAWPRRHADTPAWMGEQSIEGKRLMVWAEQGLGDTLHFSRYVPMLRDRGAQVVFEVQPALKSLLSRLPGCEVIGRGEAAARCDFQAPLLSLPLIFGTTLENIPASVPYLSADPAKLAAWRERIAPTAGRPSIAIACSGRPAQKDDAFRSVPLAAFSPLTDFADLYVVQPDLREADRDTLARTPGMRGFEGEIRDFDDSAAILANVDRVITVDTSLAHLAGALARPVWILSPWTPTWRWLEGRSDSPWYPTARLFRQEKRGDWDAVMRRVHSLLRAELELELGARPCC